MRKIFITGAAGFISSHLTEKCVAQGYQVRAFVRYNSRNYWGWLENSKYLNRIEVISGDIRDYDSVFQAMKGCDTVFHLAALIGIPYSYISPLAYIRTNVEGTYNILQAARHLQFKEIIITSTSETYGTAQYVPIDEKHPLVGQSPYAASKIAADQLAVSFYKSFKMPIKIVRPFNTYGPRQSARAIIPSVVVQLMKGRRVIKLGSLFPVRDLTYIEDTVNGFLEIAKSKDLYGEVTNLGSNQEISIGDLARLTAKLMKKRIKIISDKKRIRPEESEVLRLCCDNTKVRTKTKWRPRYSLPHGIQKTIQWFKMNHRLYKADLFNL